MKQLGLKITGHAPTVTQTNHPLFPTAQESAKGDALKATTVRFLKVVSDHTLSGGATVEQVMEALGSDHPKGVGSKSATINNLLVASGFAPSDVYSSARDPLGVRWWKAGPKMQEALNVLDPL